MKILKNKILRFILIFFAALLLFVLSLTLVYTIPNGIVEKNVTNSLNFIEEEDDTTSKFFFYSTDATKLDDNTDKVMLEGSIIQSGNQNALEAGMDINDYPRYWHGYQIVLRPMLIIFSYPQIRYINILITFILLGLIFSQIHKRINVAAAIAFMASIVSINIFIVPMSMSYMSVFAIMLISTYLIFYFYDPAKPGKIAESFFIIGIITSFFDLLTAPVISLGIPLLSVLSLNLKYDEKNAFKKNFLNLFSYSALWTLGYGLCWFAKWAIGSLVLHKNVIRDAINTILFRVEGNEEYPVTRISMLKTNIRNLFFFEVPNGRNIIVVQLLVSFLIFGVLFFFYRKKISYLKNVLPFLVVGLFPYIWFNVLANHSQIHQWFVYRIQIITVFAILLSAIFCLDWDKIKNSLKNIKRRH